MSYSGATAASSIANPPRLLIAGFASVPQTTTLTTQGATNNNAAPGGQGGALWYYTSTNSSTDLTTSNFFSDAWYLGMRPGDLVLGCFFSSNGSTVTTFQGAIGSVSTAGANLTTGSLMTSTFN